MFFKQTFTFKWKLAVAFIGLSLIACVVKTMANSQHIRFGGWVTYWDFNRGMNTAHQGKGIYGDIFLFSTQLDVDGTPIMVNSNAIDYHSAIDQLKASGFQTWMTFVNDVKSIDDDKSILKDPQMVHHILEDNTLRLRHRRNIIELALKYGVSGVDIDYENLLPEDRVHFSRFISELSNELKKRNLSLSVTVQPKTRDRPTLKNGAMDWSEICRHANRLQIMLYNLHNQKTRPGPVATQDWISSVLNYAKTKCDAKTIVPILKVSGMHWGPTKNEAIQYSRAMSLKSRHGAKLERETSGQVPFFSYPSNNKKGIIYFEDARSLKMKIKRIKTLGFKNIVFWSLGRQDPELTSQLKEFF